MFFMFVFCRVCNILVCVLLLVCVSVVGVWFGFCEDVCVNMCVRVDLWCVCIFGILCV